MCVSIHTVYTNFFLSSAKSSEECTTKLSQTKKQPIINDDEWHSRKDWEIDGSKKKKKVCPVEYVRHVLAINFSLYIAFFFLNTPLSTLFSPSNY